MRCDEVRAAARARRRRPESIPRSQRHVETCLRCQAELARYRRLLRTLALLRTRYVEPTPGLLGETLAALTDAAERRRAPHAALGSPARVRRGDRRHRGRRRRDGRAADRPLPQALGCASPADRP